MPRWNDSEILPVGPEEVAAPAADESRSAVVGPDGAPAPIAAGGDEPGADAAQSTAASAGAPARGRRRHGRVVRRSLVALAAIIVVLAGYYAFGLYQVWHTARTDGARPADAIVVLGAAQYNGRPSPVLAARLDHALALWRKGYAKRVVVTGGKQPGDRYTEATASADYLIARGVPDSAILREVQGHNTWDSLASTARILRNRDLRSVLIVSDPYHSLRARQTARELGLDADASPTRTSPVRGWAEWKRMFKEAAGVSVGRIIGYRRLLEISG